MSKQTEEWRDIPGCNGYYQASDWGRIRSYHPTGRPPKGGDGKAKTPRIMRPYLSVKSTYNVSIVSEPANQRERGKRKSTFIPVGRLVFLTFRGEIPEGMAVAHRNGDVRDNRLCNLELRRRDAHSAELMRKYAAGGSNRIPVLKIDRNLNVLEAYSCSDAAAKANGAINGNTVYGYCRHIPKRTVFAPDGYIYAFDNERHLKKTLERAMAELDAIGERYDAPATERYYDLAPYDPASEETSEPDDSAPWEDAPALIGGRI